ncbi:hypothetical protein JMUB7516_27130 [Staphylococcus aureus]
MQRSLVGSEMCIRDRTKYYSQKYLTFSNKWLWQKDNGTIHATLLQFSWYSHIQVYGPESWGNINQLRNKSVDIFGIKDQETIQVLPLSQDCLLYTSPSPRDYAASRMPSSA